MKWLKLEVLKPYLLATIKDDSLPALSRIFNAQLIARLNINQGDGDGGLLLFRKGLEISQQSCYCFVDTLNQIKSGCLPYLPW